MKKTFSITMLLGLSVPFFYSYADETTFLMDERPWGVYLEVDEGSSKEGLYNKGKTKLFVPVKKTENGLLFVDLRTFHNESQSKNFNIGLGYRNKLAKDIVGGINVSTSKTESKSGKVYSQQSFGIEVLAPSYEINANYYFSTNKDSKTLSSIDTYTSALDGQGGANFYHTVITKKERRSNGYDTHVSYTIPYRPYDMSMSIGAGYYNFNGEEGHQDQRGKIFNFNAEKKFNFFGNEFSASAEVGRFDDSFLGEDNYVMVRMKYQFGQGKTSRGLVKKRIYDDKLYKMPKRIDQAVVNSVVTKDKYTTKGKFHIEQNTHDRYDVVTANQDLAQIVQSSKDGSLLLLDGAEGDFLIDKLADAKVNQSFVGGSSVVKVTGPKGEVAYLALPGEKARIVYSPNNDIVRGATNATGNNIEEVYVQEDTNYGDNLVFNDSFENCHEIGRRGWKVHADLCGWEVDRDYNDAPIEVQKGIVTSSFHGNAHIELDSHNKNGFTKSNANVYQMLDTMHGKVYRLTYYYQARVVGNNNTNGVEVKWEGETIAENNADQRGWQKVTRYVRSNDGDEDGKSRLDFIGKGNEDTYGGLIDLVTVEEL